MGFLNAKLRQYAEVLKELGNKDTQMTAAHAIGYKSELSEKLPSLELTCMAVMLSALGNADLFILKTALGIQSVLGSETPCISSLPQPNTADFCCHNRHWCLR